MSVSDLTNEQRAILKAVEDGRAIRANEHGPAITREQFGWAAAQMVKKPPLVRFVKDGTWPNERKRMELTEIGHAALATGRIEP